MCSYDFFCYVQRYFKAKELLDKYGGAKHAARVLRYEAPIKEEIARVEKRLAARRNKPIV